MISAYKLIHLPKGVSPFLNNNSNKNVMMIRQFSSTTETSKRGGGLFQRVSSFFAGAGLTALCSQYFLYEEIKQGNATMIKKQNDIEKRISLLENTKK